MSRKFQGRRFTIALAVSTVLFVVSSASINAQEVGEEVPTLEENLVEEIAEDITLPTDPTVPAEIVVEGDEAVIIDADTAAIELTDAGPVPKRVVLQPGTTVVWKNGGKSAVTVNFIGKAISTTCKAPRGFSIGGKGVYTSSPISPGGIASLCFLEPELYVYEVRAPAGKTGNSEEPRMIGAVQIIRE